MNIDFFLIVVIIIVFVCLSYYYVKNKEYFTSSPNTKLNAEQLLQKSAVELFMNQNPNYVIGDGDNLDTQHMTEEERKEYITKIVKEASDEFCPVGPNYDSKDYIKKTAIETCAKCTKCPTKVKLDDYVLKTTIPPIQKCPSCICPKIKLEAGLCSKCPEPKNNCPQPKPCDIEQCKDVIKCEPHQKQVSCPKCPAPSPCPQLQHQVCPSLKLPKNNIKCPAPSPCPMANPCKDGDGRCPDKKCPKCTFKGVDTVVINKTSNEIVNELLNSDDPKLLELLNTLKNKLNLNENPPLDINNLKKDISNIIDNKLDSLDNTKNHIHPDQFIKQEPTQYTPEPTTYTPEPTTGFVKAAPTISSTNLELNINPKLETEPNTKKKSGLKNTFAPFFNNRLFNNKLAPSGYKCDGDECNYSNV